MFNILICVKALSIFFPISPPRQSNSRTKCPLELPPICGLQGILAIASNVVENKRVFKPILAAAKAASHPACPAPITAISYFPALYFIFLLLFTKIIHFLSFCQFFLFTFSLNSFQSLLSQLFTH